MRLKGGGEYLMHECEIPPSPLSFRLSAAFIFRLFSPNDRTGAEYSFVRMFLRSFTVICVGICAFALFTAFWAFLRGSEQIVQIGKQLEAEMVVWRKLESKAMEMIETHRTKRIEKRQAILLADDRPICQCSVVGQHCPPGPPGPTGPPGIPGKPGAKGSDGLPGVPAIVVHFYRFLDGMCHHCPMGKPGKRGGPGLQGTAGHSGPQGQKGTPGAKGKVGPIGEEGELGKSGTEGQTGTKGLRGLDGTVGENGRPGPKGEMGKMGRRGERGERGPTGKVGAPGETAPPGAEGKHGTPGLIAPPGFPGADGEPGSDGGYCPCPERSKLSRVVIP